MRSTAQGLRTVNLATHEQESTSHTYVIQNCDTQRLNGPQPEGKAETTGQAHQGKREPSKDHSAHTKVERGKCGGTSQQHKGKTSVKGQPVCWKQFVAEAIPSSESLTASGKRFGPLGGWK